MRIALPLILLALAAAPAPDAVRDRVIANAKALSPSALVFDRTTYVVKSGGGQTDKVTHVEHWDGHAWTLLSVNGKPPSASEIKEVQKTEASLPVPGYHRLAALMAVATERSTDGQGRAVFHIPQLPAGSVPSSSGDLSSHLSGEVTVIVPVTGEPWVQRLKLTSHEPFKMGWVLKVVKFDQISEYKLDAAGSPRLASQTADSTGTLLGISGGQHNEVTFVYR